MKENEEFSNLEEEEDLAVYSNRLKEKIPFPNPSNLQLIELELSVQDCSYKECHCNG